MSTWDRVTAQIPCAICGKTDWCSVGAEFRICRRRDDGTGHAKVDRGGAEYWVYRREEVSVTAGPWPIAPRPRASTLTASDTHRVYLSILNQLELSAPDHRDLLRRGLDAADIVFRQYRTLPRENSRGVLASALAKYGRAHCLEVPGVIRDDHGQVTLAGAPGLVVPVRDERGDITALKIRRRSAAASKYVYLSSTHVGGPGPGSPVHVPLHEERPQQTVRLTEGELKADVATARSGLLTIAIAGVGAWRRALPVLRTLGATTCRLALDADVRTNPHVARALMTMATHLVEQGLAIELELWDPLWKGIDDCLVAGGTTTVIPNDRALAACADVGPKAVSTAT